MSLVNIVFESLAAVQTTIHCQWLSECGDFRVTGPGRLVSLTGNAAADSERRPSRMPQGSGLKRLLPCVIISECCKVRVKLTVTRLRRTGTERAIGPYCAVEHRSSTAVTVTRLHVLLRPRSPQCCQHYLPDGGKGTEPSGGGSHGGARPTSLAMARGNPSPLFLLLLLVHCC